MDSGSHIWLQSLDNSYCIYGVWVQAHLEYKFRMKEMHTNTRHIIIHCQLFSSYKIVSEKVMLFFFFFKVCDGICEWLQAGIPEFSVNLTSFSSLGCLLFMTHAFLDLSGYVLYKFVEKWDSVFKAFVCLLVFVFPLKNICVLSVFQWQPAAHFPRKFMPKIQIAVDSLAGIHRAGLVGRVPNWVMDSLHYPWQVLHFGIFKQKQTKSTFVLWFQYFLMLQFSHFCLLICCSDGFYVLQSQIGLCLVWCSI